MSEAKVIGRIQLNDLTPDQLRDRIIAELRSPWLDYETVGEFYRQMGSARRNAGQLWAVLKEVEKEIGQRRNLFEHR